MVVYTIASGKGGVGKTTYVVNIAIAMSDLGLNVLIIDSDIGMANFEMMMDINPNENASLHEVLAGDINAIDAIIKTPYGIDVLPCGMSIKGFKKSNPDKIRNVIADINESYDYIFIDTPSGIAREVITPIAIADEVILITTPDLPSITNAVKTKNIADAVKTKVKGVVVNRVMNIKSEVSNEKIEKMMHAKVIGTIPYDINIVKSILHKLPIIRKSSKSDASNSIKEIAMDIANISKKEEEKTKGGGFFSKIKWS